jgi:hypothetical protein
VGRKALEQDREHHGRDEAAGPDDLKLLLAHRAQRSRGREASPARAADSGPCLGSVS